MVFKAAHMNVVSDDLKGNNGIGRYIFLPGSDTRAESIATRFQNVEVKKHSRHHNLYMGTITYEGNKIDVASISTGMGTPSLDIVVSELIKLGAKRFLRVGTCGSLQNYIKIGDFTVATGAVKDDGATNAYMPLEIPAIASIDMILAAEKSSAKLNFDNRMYYGVVHTKASLYGREFSHDSPLRKVNADYMQILTDSGVESSEMEAGMLFTLVAIQNAKKNCNSFRDIRSLKSGAICVSVTEGDKFVDKETMSKITEELVELSITTIGELALVELTK